MDTFSENAGKLLLSMQSRRELELMEMKVKELKAAVHTKKLKLDCPVNQLVKSLLLSTNNEDAARCLSKVYDQLVLLKCRHKEHDDGASGVLRDTLAVFTVGTLPVNIKFQIRERVEDAYQGGKKKTSMYSLSWCKPRCFPYNSYRVSADEEIWRIYPDGREPNTYDKSNGDALYSKMKIVEMEAHEFMKYLSRMIVDLTEREGYFKKFNVDQDIFPLIDELLLPELSAKRKQLKNRKSVDVEEDEKENIQVNFSKRMKVLNITSAPVC